MDYSGEFPWLIVGILAVSALIGGVLGANADVEIGSMYDKPTDANRLDSSETYELTTGEKIKNTVIGASLGLAAGGAIVATGGAIVGAIYGAGATYLGVTAFQGFAIGALAIDSSAFLILPVFGISIEAVEYERPTPPSIP